MMQPLTLCAEALLLTGFVRSTPLNRPVSRLRVASSRCVRPFRRLTAHKDTFSNKN
jgi:hypothetical protein